MINQCGGLWGFANAALNVIQAVALAYMADRSRRVRSSDTRRRSTDLPLEPEATEDLEVES